MAKMSYSRQVAMEVLFTGHGPTTFAGFDHNLSNSHLEELFLYNAKMNGVNLAHSNLKGAKLVGQCDLSNVNLSFADLTATQLPEAVLFKANFRCSIMHSIIAPGAQFIKAKLSDAKLCWADLTGADLTGAALFNTDFTGAHLHDIIIDDWNRLEKVKSLYDAKGLPEHIRQRLKKDLPVLFERRDEMPF